MQVGVRELARTEAKADAGQKVGPTATEVLANIDAMVLVPTSAGRRNQSWEAAGLLDLIADLEVGGAAATFLP
jgi:hypothetical protein